ncbi:hypothetical protein GR248_01865 [Rhizobium leguminosarum]|uniref:hypothetical protein n=1 Tax=Rhizobium leguminosarum TaxID=384 RepID=UPI0013C8A94E|nr:hypothetical protein [Rhizobium leguminosarum]NEI89552.1 hypothetical protein [Rhizobium leguminosarum]
MTTEAYVDKLMSMSRCPVCGSDIAAEKAAPKGSTFPLAEVRFTCSARFWADGRSIISSSPCRSGSLLAAKLMTIEAEGKHTLSAAETTSRRTK